MPFSYSNDAVSSSFPHPPTPPRRPPPQRDIASAAPVLAATMLVEIAVALLGKLSPQLPVMNLTVPFKTLTGFALLTGSLALWPRFVEARAIQRVRHGAYKLSRRITRQLCIRVQGDDVLHAGQRRRVADHQGKAAAVALPQQPI